MGVAVLNPRDVLKNPSPQQALIFPPPKMKVLNPSANSIPKPNRNNRNRAKQSPLQLRNDLHRTRPASTIKPQVNKPVMGHVKILKRGEQLLNTPDRAPETVKVVLEKPDMVTTVRLAPKPEQNPTEKVAGLYAGSSVFVASPPPSSVPLPAFLKTSAISDATSDLRRILRLDFP
ncbi:hypothetical protein L6164_015710 [Bauhinia variegata]|uniref:Uncharacterized protein n=1 Tax=Bauhinia variegata TaxID=167791 RepID=A0ACB9NLE4_BAUVA|nr:hypothetical protein L6164_015710 [Bauhinia variegata]